MAAPASMDVMELLRLEGIDPEKRAVVSREELRIVLEALAVRLGRSPAGPRDSPNPLGVLARGSTVRLGPWGARRR